MAIRDLMYSFRTNSAWIDGMREASEKTPLSVSQFIQLAAEEGKDTVLNKFRKEGEHEKVPSDV